MTRVAVNRPRFALALASMVFVTACSSREARWEYGPLREDPNEGQAASAAATTFDADTMERLIVDQGCAGCHTFHGERLVGPPLDRMQGASRKFRDGSTGVVDTAYLVESILEPRAKVVEGFADVMPSYADRIDEAEAESLAVYLESLH